MSADLNQNPKILRNFIALHNGLLYISIIFAYFSHKGVDLAGCLQIQALFNVALFVLEVPSGYLSDRYSRRWVLIAGAVIELIGMILMYFAWGFWQLLFAELIIAVGLSLISGTASAILYDSLLAMGREQEFGKQEGKARSWGAYATGIAGLAGGFLFTIDPQLPMLVTCIVVFIGVLCLCQITEPPIHKPQSTEHPIKQLGRFMHYAVKGHAEIPWLLAYSATIVGGTAIGFWLTQLYWESAGLPYWAFGVLFLTMQLGRGVCHDHAMWIANAVGHRRLFIGLWILLVIGVLGQGVTNHVSMIWLSFLPSFIFGVGHVVILSLLNDRVASHMRATVLSVESMFWRLMFVVSVPIITTVEEHHGLQSLFFGLGGFWLVAGVIPIAMLIRKRVI